MPISPDPLIALFVVELLTPLHAALTTEMLLYGVHLVLFILCIYVLLKRRATLQYAILIAVTIMFVLSTADIALTLRMMLKDLPAFLHGRMTIEVMSRRVYPKNPIFVTNNFIADLLLIYRCYVVWGKKLAIIAISTVLLMADSIWGWVGIVVPFPATSKQFTPYLWSLFAMNIVMTTLTAGRIWWVNRKTKEIMGKEHYSVYNTAIAILIESGLLYSIVIFITLFSAAKTTLAGTMIFMMYRTVAIVPTLMVVQVGLGWRFQSDTETGTWGPETTGPTAHDITVPTAELVRTGNQPYYEMTGRAHRCSRET